MKSTERRESTQELERLNPASALQHEPLAEELIIAFGEIIDRELALLEQRFRHLETPRSRRRGFGR